MLSQADQLHQLAQQRLRNVVGGAVRNLNATVSLERSAELRDAYAAAVAQLVSAGQWQAGKLALAYMAGYVAPVHTPDLGRALEGTLLTPDDPKAFVGILRTWSLLDDGVAEAEAREAGGSIAGNLAEGDMSAAMREGLDEGADAAEREPMWEKVAAPGACDWCQMIADGGARYYAADTVPFHTHGPCQCGAAPDFEEVRGRGPD